MTEPKAEIADAPATSPLLAEGWGIPDCASPNDEPGAPQIAGTGPTTIDITDLDWRMIREGIITEHEIAELLKGI